MPDLLLSIQNDFGVISIPDLFFTEYMPHANGDFVKVYLFLIYAIQRRLTVSVSTLADALDCSERDVDRALTYWDNVGLLSAKRDEDGCLCALELKSISDEQAKQIAPRPTRTASASQTSAKHYEAETFESDDDATIMVNDLEERSASVPFSQRGTASPTEKGWRSVKHFAQEPALAASTTVKSENVAASEKANSVHAVNSAATKSVNPVNSATTKSVNPAAASQTSLPAYMQEFKQDQFQEAMSIINVMWGRPMNTTVIERFKAIFLLFNQQSDLLIRLMEHCHEYMAPPSAKNDNRITYVEKVANSWFLEGVRSVADADRLLSLHEEQKESDEYASRIMYQLYGDRKRLPLPAEQDKISRWMNEYKMPIEVVEYVCSKAVLSRGNKGIPYIDSRLSDFHKGGAHTLEQVKAYEQAHPYMAPTSSDAAGKDSLANGSVNRSANSNNTARAGMTQPRKTALHNFEQRDYSSIPNYNDKLLGYAMKKAISEEAKKNSTSSQP